MGNTESLSTWTGFCNTSDIISPIFLASNANPVLGNQTINSGIYQARNTILSITLIQAVV